MKYKYISSTNSTMLYVMIESASTRAYYRLIVLDHIGTLLTYLHNFNAYSHMTNTQAIFRLV